MNLNTKNWKPFRIDTIFDIFTGGDLIMGSIEEGAIPIASNIIENNNIAAYTDVIPGRKLFDHTKSISIADRGKFWAFIQPLDFYLATRVKGLVCKDDNILNKYQMAFVVSVINQESFKFSYGRNCCAHLPDIEISLPIVFDSNEKPRIDETKRYSKEGYVPDWNVMEQFMLSLHHKPLTTKIKKQTIQLDILKWGEFRLGDYISQIYKAKPINKDDLVPVKNTGKAIRYITRTSVDNGCELLADRSEIPPQIIENANAITIGDTTATCFYQDEEFITGDHMVVVRADDWLNKYTALFIITILNREQYKYSYGRAFLKDRIKETVIKLPMDCAGNPDWKFMEKYIKSLPYGDRL